MAKQTSTNLPNTIFDKQPPSLIYRYKSQYYGEKAIY